MTFQVGGLASGLDSKTIISQLMSIESQPKTRMQWNQQLWNTRQQSWSTLNTKLLAMQGSANSLMSPLLWDTSSFTGGGTPTPGAWGATSSNVGVAGATVSGTPTAGTYNVNVTTLARGEIDVSSGNLQTSQSGILDSAAFYSGTTGTLATSASTILSLKNAAGKSFGFNNGSTITMSYAVNGGATQTATFNVTTTSKLSDLQTFVQNTIGNGATASIVNGKIEITTAPGTANAVTSFALTAKKANGAAINAFNTAYAATTTTQVQAAKNAGLQAAGSIVVNMSGTNYTVNLATGDDKAAIVSKINTAAGAAVVASLDASNNIVMQSKTPGAASAFTVSTSGGASVLSFAETQSAADTTYSVNGTAYTTTNNNGITTAIPGLTLNLSGVGSTSITVAQQEPASASAAQDAWIAKVVAAVKDFVGKYNDVQNLVYQKTQVEKRVASAKSAADFVRGDMSSNTDFANVGFDIRALAIDKVNGLAGGSNLLSDFGINTSFTIGGGGANGTLTVDEAKLTAALKANPAAVQSALTQVGTGSATAINADDGIIRKLSKEVSLLRTGGRVDTAMASATAQSKSIQASLDLFDVRLAKREEYFKNVFANLEKNLSSLQSKSNWLQGQLAQFGSSAG